MNVVRARLKSLKRFRDSGDIEFAKGINVVVGRNNVGKTTLIDAISGRLTSAPHRSPTATPTPEFEGAPSEVEVVVRFSQEEAEAIFRNRTQIVAPWRADADEILAAINEFQRNGGDFVLNRVRPNSHLYNLPALEIAESWVVFSAGDGLKPMFWKATSNGSGNTDTYIHWLINNAHNRMYAFRAERLNVSSSAFGSNSVLAPDAHNLPEVLNNLQSSNRPKYRRFVSHVQTVFPEITDVTIAPVSNTHVKIKLWDFDPALEREDLAVELAHSGTGIGQVLAMLYVVVTSPTGNVILIDEPHSFLHPGALRKLFEIFSQEYSNHQYIITTNSPSAILSAAPASVNLIERAEHEAVVRPVRTDSASEATLFMDSVGAHLSDVFGADSILWVEGRTEERCFPLIFETFAPHESRGLLTRSFVATGDLSRRDAERVFHIYRRLSSGPSLIPPAIGFVFDREARSASEMAQLREASGGLAHFLKRRMYENYLLVSGHIAQLLNDLDSTKSEEYTAQGIEEWIANDPRPDRYWDPRATAKKPFSAEWYDQIDGARLLKCLFSDLTSTRVVYDKVPHGHLLTTACLKAHDEHVQRLAFEELLPIIRPQPPRARSA